MTLIETCKNVEERSDDEEIIQQMRLVVGLFDVLPALGPDTPVLRLSTNYHVPSTLLSVLYEC